MFSPTERELYYTLNYQGAKVRAEMIVLAAAASDSAFAEVFEDYINREEASEAEKNDMLGFANQVIEDQRERVVNRLLSSPPKKISEVYSMLQDTAKTIDEEVEAKEIREEFLQEFAEEAEQ